MSDIRTQFNLQRSRYDVRHFYEWIGYNFGPHIGEWLDLFNDRQGAQVHRVCVIAPRDHSKSTTLRIQALHMLLFQRWRNKPFTIWLFSASKDLAANRLEEIREDLKRHPELSAMLDESKGGKWELRLTNGSWIKATSVGSAIRGEHPACIILDDVLDDQYDMNDKQTREWFRKKLTPMLSPGTSLFCVGTPMALTDLYHTEMLNNPAWKTWKKPAIINWDEYSKDPKNVEPEVLWPEHRSASFLLEQKLAMGDLAFTQEYLCRVVDDDSAVFPSRLTRKNLDMDASVEPIKTHEGQYAIGFDPSHGIGQDYSVMVILRQDKEGFIHLVNIWRHNDYEPTKQVDEIIRLCGDYGNPIFASENAGFQRLYKALLDQRNATINFVPSSVNNRVLKQGLLMRARSWFEREKVILPYGDDTTRKIVNVLLNELETHAWDGGTIVDKGKHNDTVMAFAHALDQFRTKAANNMPIAAKGVSVESWNKRGKPKRRDSNPTSGKYVRWGA
tara:strand:+ start:4170 stop:5675 length:1506 start_codon:yes stop_codon:yes gene_type:complete